MCGGSVTHPSDQNAPFLNEPQDAVEVIAQSVQNWMMSNSMTLAITESLTMSGMVTTGSSTVSDRASQSVVFTVEGVCQQAVSKTSNYTVKVPFSQMNAAYRSIGRTGGKIVSVQVGNVVPAVPASVEGDE